MNKVAAVALVSLTLSGLATDADAQAETRPEMVNFLGAGAAWSGQSACMQRRVFVDIVELVDIVPGAPPPGRLKLVQASVFDIDTCANQFLLAADGSSPLPPNAGIDPALTTASVHATVELNCGPFSPPCSPFSVDIDLTWTGIGAINRMARADHSICPAFFVVTAHDAEATRSATLTGDVSSGGTSLVAGLTLDESFMEDLHLGRTETILPPLPGPFHPCHE